MRIRPYWTLCPTWNVWSPKAEPLPETVTRRWKISICTTCMGRVEDLKRTLPVNISDNSDYPEVEFVVVNYNSQDDMHEYMTSSAMLSHLLSGKVRYLRTRLPRFFSMSHSRNVAFMNATGDIVTNVDADNFTGKEFASYLNRLANIRPHRVIFAKGKRRINGRLGMFKNDFVSLGGYDEELIGYGGDDYSLLLRAMYSNFTLMWWVGSRKDFMRRIVTPRDHVGINMENPDWRETERMNREIILKNLKQGKFVANRNRSWRQAEDLEVHS